MRGLILLVMICGAAVLQAQDAPFLFDAPLRTQHVALPSDAANPQAKPEVRCVVYADLLVKEIDRGEVGDERIALQMLGLGAKPPACREQPADGEQAIDNWNGYFLGRRGPYLFLRAADGSNGGQGFAVFDLARQPLFRDNSAGVQSLALLQGANDPAPLVLRYRRVYLAPCSLRSDGAACWALIRQATGLQQAHAPDCAAAYAAMERGQAGKALDDARRDPSVLEYQVETVLDAQGVSRITPLSGVLACRPAA